MSLHPSSTPASSRVYGPVPSRRFGLSLGVDLVPRKVCAYDCVYCQVGPTTTKTVSRQAFFAVDDVLRQVEQALREGARPDVITLAGSGEPTLFQSLGALVRGLKELTDIPVVLLTGGGTLAMDDVAVDVMEVDVLAPSLDAKDEEQFQRVNRPHPALRFSEVVEGLRRVAQAFRGQVRLEVMVVPGYNADEASLERLAALCATIPATSVDVNTPVRPAHGAVGPASAQTMRRACDLMGPRARIVGEPRGVGVAPADGLEERLIQILARRPSTLRDLARATGESLEELTSVVDRLVGAGIVEERPSHTEVFFWVPPPHTQASGGASLGRRTEHA